MSQKVVSGSKGNNHNPKALLANLEKKIFKNPTNVDALHQIIELYKKKQVPYNSSLFISYILSYTNLVKFTQHQWVNYIEKIISKTKTQEEKIEVFLLFDQAFDQGYYYDIGKLYMKYSLELFKNSYITFNKIKIIAEKNLSQFSQDFKLGSKVFKRTRKILDQILELPLAENNPKIQNDIKNYKTQLFLRELKIPLEGIQEAYENFIEFINESEEKNPKILKQGQEDYDLTLLNLNNYLTIEEQFIKISENLELEEINSFLSDLECLPWLDLKKHQNYIEKFLEAIENNQNQMENNEKEDLDCDSNSVKNLEDMKKELIHNYTEFSKEQLTNKEQISIFKRASFIIQDDLAIAQHVIKCLEIEKEDIEIVLQEFQRFIYQNRNSIEQMYKIYLLQIEFYCRTYYQLSIDEFAEKENLENAKQLLRNTFKSANKKFYELSFTEALKPECDQYMNEILIKSAHAETFIIKDHEAMVKIMEDVVKYSGDKKRSWDEYIFFEMHFNNIKNVRKLYKRGCEYCRDQTEQLFESYEEFEKMYGSVEDFKVFENKLNDFMELEEETIKQQEEILQEVEQELDQDSQINDNNNEQSSNDIHNAQNISLEEEEDEENQDQDEKQQEENQQVQQEEQNQQVQIEIEDKKQNKKKDDNYKLQRLNIKRKGEHLDSKPTKNVKTENTNNPPELTVYVKNLPENYDENDISNLITSKILKEVEVKAIRIVRNYKNNKSKGYGYVDCKTIQGVKDIAKELNNKKIDENHILFAAQSEPPKKAYQSDDSTVFLNNLPFSITEDLIREKFLSEYEIKEIRIITDENGKPKGYAYVQFASKEDKEKQFEHFNKNPYINSRKIHIQFSDSSTSLKKRDNYVVFIKGLPFKARESDLEKFFEGKKIRQCVIVRDQNNRPKGLAYVEFETQEEMIDAIKMPNPVMKNRNLQIIKSDRKITEKKPTEKEKEFEQKENKTNADFVKFLD